MDMKKITIYLLSFFFFTGNVSFGFSQESLVNKMAGFRSQSISSKTDSEKFIYNDSLQNVLYEFLGNENSFHSELGKKIQYLGDIFSQDGEIRIITWNISLKDGTHDYFCYIQLKPNEKGISTWHELTDHHKTLTRPKYKSLKKENWYGCLYYSIIPVKIDKKNAYTLLAWEGHNNYSNKKIIDILTFSTRGDPVFGKAVFEGEKHTSRRVIFEYSKEAYLLLRYNEDSKQIIFNRLEPPKPELEGLYSFYTPSLIYDSYVFKKGKWVLHPDINPKNGKSNKEFHNPLKAPKPPKE